MLNVDFLLAYMALTFVFGIFISTMSLVLEELELHRVPRARDLLVLITVAAVKNFGYRQINTVWRVAGWCQFLTGITSWGEMKRKGLANV